MSNDGMDQRHNGSKGLGSMTAKENSDAIGFSEDSNQHASESEEVGSFDLLKDANYYENLAKEDRRMVAACTNPDLSIRLREAAILHEREARKLRREERKGARLESSRRPWANFRYGHIINKDIDSADGLLPESFETYQIVEPGNIVMRLAGST